MGINHMANKKPTPKKLTWSNQKIKYKNLIDWDKNPVKISKKEREALKESLEKFGHVIQFVAAAPIVKGVAPLLDGHQRKLVDVSDRKISPDTIVDVRVPSRKLTEDERKELVIRLRKNTGQFDFEKLQNFFEPEKLINWGFAKTELKAGGFQFTEPEVEVFGLEDRLKELQDKWKVENGDLYKIGNHFLICGDSKDKKNIDRLMQGNTADLMLIDPPYCSGGFQESGKKSGSIGTRGNETIENDTLSTRGYIALMKEIFLRASEIGVGVSYTFTDWRMWVNLFDIMESSGFGVRQMIVWDKGTPGMGAGWRSQHELIMAGMRVTQPFNPKKAQGNVIQSKRTGNKNHATEKPVELIQKILDVNDMAQTVVDLFSGSGVVMSAGELLGKQVFSSEKTPKYCAATIERMFITYGLKPVLIERANGKKK